MAELERRLTPRVMILRVQPSRPSGPFIVAPRMTGGRTVAVVGPDEAVISPATSAGADIIGRDLVRGIAVIGSASADDSVVTPRTGTPRTGPRYVVSLEATAQGPALRPVYVGRTGLFEDPRTSTPFLTLEAVQHALPRGAAIFSLEGIFLGLVTDTGATTLLISGDFLRTAAETAERTSAPQLADLGVDVQDANSALLRAAGAEFGVVVNHIRAQGVTNGGLQPGDVILSVDGNEVRTAAEYHQIEQSRRPGQPVTLVVVRRGERREITHRAGSRGADQQEAPGELGLVGMAVPGAGIDVVSVRPGSAAARSGVRRGDLIVTVNGQPAGSVAALSRSFRSIPAGGALLISIQRGQQHRVLALEKR